MLEFLLDLIFPIKCLNCGREGYYICKGCELFASEAALICPICQKSSFTGETHASCFTLHGLDGLVSVWDYDGPVKEAIGKIKYNFITHATKEIMTKAFRTMARDQDRFAPFLAFLSNRSDKSNRSDMTYLTCTPMFRRKEKKRGFNQAELFAKEISAITGAPVLRLLAKTRDTKSQTELSRGERLRNVQNSIRPISPISPIDPIGPARNVVLVDDVWTTGATMKECCKILKRFGVQKVWGFTLAKTL